MGEVAASDNFADRVKKTLKADLGKSGLEVDVQTEAIPNTRLHRVIIVSRQLQELGPAERQDLVWRIMGEHFSRDEQLRVSMILTLAPDEIDLDEDEQ
jgi:acid stress-induced BolA-like protein IbaG/YrbA